MKNSSHSLQITDLILSMARPFTLCFLALDLGTRKVPVDKIKFTQSTISPEFHKSVPVVPFRKCKPFTDPIHTIKWSTTTSGMSSIDNRHLHSLRLAQLPEIECRIHQPKERLTSTNSGRFQVHVAIPASTSGTLIHNWLVLRVKANI